MKKYIGCSGYHYDDWRGKFYDKTLPKKEWLSFYASKFNSLEINSSFYRLPEKKTLKKWYDETPEKFRFTVKGSQYITHSKKLKVDKDLKEGLQKLYDVASVFDNKLGCILWQLPGNLNYKKDKLEKFCKELDPAFKNVLEFRDKSWFNDEAMEILSENEVTYCSLSAPDDLTEDIHQTSDYVYIRFHGKKEWYHYSYRKDQLEKWKRKIDELTDNPKEVYAYFNNDVDANAPGDALKFADILN